MKAWEICKKENVGKMYVDDKEGVKWKVEQKYKDIFDLYDNENDSINYYGYGISELVEMNFEETIDWNEVPIDTKILVRNYKENKWKKRYFAKYENGTVYAWYNGGTSYSQSDTIDWDCAKLYKGEKK